MIDLIMRYEMICAAISFNLTWIGVLAQAEMPSSISGLLMQFGGLGLAVWLVYHHTTVTIPKLQQEFKAERLEMLSHFELSLKEKRDAYFSELEKMRDMHCKYVKSTGEHN